MPLATKNGSLIIKSGSIAENCNCCASGWYCYSEECPCNYSKPMPNSLQATLSFSLASDMYGIALGNFFGAYLSTWRVTPQQASQINGTYTLTRSSGCSYVFQGNNVDIRVIVGTSSGSFNNETLNAGCSASQTNVHVLRLAFTVPALYPEEYWSSAQNNLCPGHPSYVNNAASRTYNRQDGVVSCPTITNQAWNDICRWQPAFPLYSRGMRLDGAVGGRDVPACSSKNLSLISHSWAFDVVYTDTSGLAPIEGRLSRAVTLTVSE